MKLENSNCFRVSNLLKDSWKVYFFHYVSVLTVLEINLKERCPFTVEEYNFFKFNLAA